MKSFLGLAIALGALHLSCSNMDELGSSNFAKDNRKTSLDASAPVTVDSSWVFQTFEDNEFEMQLLANQWKTSTGIQFIEKPQLGKLIYDSEKSSWIYIPKKDVFGEDKFTIELTSTNGKTIIQPVLAKILPVNDAPKANDLTLRLPKGSSIEFNINATDTEDQDLVASFSSLPENGTIEFIEGDVLKVKYTPSQNFTGSETVKLMVSDGALESESNLNFEVLNNDGLQASDGNYEVNAGQTVNGKLMWVDPDDDDLPITIEIVQNVQNGILVIDPNQENFRYTSNSSFEGNDSFQFRVRRGAMLSNTATVTIAVKKVNNPPTPTPPPSHDNYIEITCPRHQPCYGKIPAQDPQYDKFYYKLGSQPSYGTITNWDEHAGTFTYTPDPSGHWYDEDRFTFWLQDCYGYKSSTYTVKIKFEDTWVLFEDSFERDYVTKNEANFHWRLLIDDNGKGLQAANQECVDNICAKIFKNGDYGLGPMGYEQRSLFFFGREGESTHEIFLISKAFDLSQYSYVDISFMYLIMDIGDNDSKPNQYTEEYLRAEVCMYGDYECGLNPIDPTKLRSNKWIKVFQNESCCSDNGLNGRNHSAQDWKEASFRVDLIDIETRYPTCNKNNFVFRFNSRLQDGFEGNNFYNKIEDAVAIDKVRLKAGYNSGH